MASQGIENVSFTVEGMGCGGCAAGITEVLRKAAGVREAEVSFEKSLATIAYDPEATNPADLGELIRDEGYTVTPVLT
jgi:copper chaperone CopZ